MIKVFRVIIVNIIVLLTVSVVSFADEKQTAIDNIEAQCISKNPSTAGMNNCTHDAEIKWDAEMNKYYQLSNEIKTPTNCLCQNPFSCLG